MNNFTDDGLAINPVSFTASFGTGAEGPGPALQACAYYGQFKGHAVRLADQAGLRRPRSQLQRPPQLAELAYYGYRAAAACSDLVRQGPRLPQWGAPDQAIRGGPACPVVCTSAVSASPDRLKGPHLRRGPDIR